MFGAKKPEPYEPEWYHLEAIKFLAQNTVGGLWLDPGFGKTAACLAAFDVLKNEGVVDKMFVFAPIMVAQDQWPAEVNKWIDFKHLSIKFLHGEDKEHNFYNEDYDIYVANPEILYMFTRLKKGRKETYELGAFVEETFKEKGRWMLVVDESTKFKNHSSQRFHRLKPFLKLFSRRYIATGSPAPRGYENLFSQTYILDGGKSLGGNITRYRNTYFDRDPFVPNKYTLRPGAEEKILKAIEHLFLRLPPEILDLPPLTVKDVMVDLPEDAEHFYDSMQDEFLSEWNGVLSVTTSKGALQNKLRQIANGGIYNENGDPIEVHNAKSEALRSLLDGLNGKVALIGYEFDHDLERIMRVMPKNTGVVNGSNSGTKEASIAVNNFKAGRANLVAQLTTVSHGLNLQDNSTYVIYYGITYDLEVYMQFMKRVHRRGVKGRVIAYRILARNTVDEIVAIALRKKDCTQREILDYMQQQFNALVESKQ